MEKAVKLIIAILIMASTVACTNNQEALETTDVEITPAFVEAVHQYDVLYPFSEGLAAVRKDDKCGFIDTKGNLVIPCQFSYVGPFKDGLALALMEDDKTINFIDAEGNIHKTQYPLDARYYLGQLKVGYFDPEFLSFNHGVCEINYSETGESEYRTVYIDKQFNEVPKPENWTPTENENSEYEIFCEPSKDIYGDEIELRGLKDKEGKVIIPAKYNNLWLCDNGILLAFFFIEDAESHLHPYRPYGLEMYGYVDLKGNSTFTETDMGKLEGYKAAQLPIYQNLKLKEESEAAEAEESRRIAEENAPKIIEVYLEYTAQNRVLSMNGNYGCSLYDFTGLMSDMITIPEGKKWILKGVNKDNGNRIYTYSAYRGDGKLYRDRSFEIRTNSKETYTFYSGDHLRVATDPIVLNTKMEDKIIFTFIEKPEND